MCTCPENERINLGWIWTCRLCGKTHGLGLSNLVQYAVQCPARAPYSRRKRFLRLLANTYGHRVPRVSEQLTDELCARDITSTAGIYAFMRMSRFRFAKRYDALALLSFHMTGARAMPLSLRQLQWAEYKFRDIQTIHSRTRGTFPAYSWVIEQVLLCTGRMDLLQYVHLLKCRQRRAVYEDRYGKVFTGQFVLEPRATLASR